VLYAVQGDAMKLSVNELDIKRYLLGTLFIVLTACFQALVTKAQVGVAGAWEVVSLNVYELCGLKVGTFGMIANTLVLLSQILILKKDFKPYKLLMLIVVVLFGVVTNIVLYRILVFDIQNYVIRLMMCIIGYFGMGVCLAAATLIGTVQMPIENTCYVIHEKYGWDMGRVRQTPDAVCIVVSIIMSLAFGLSFKVREGTVLGMLMVGPVMAWSMKWERPLLGRYVRADESQAENQAED